MLHLLCPLDGTFTGTLNFISYGAASFSSENTQSKNILVQKTSHTLFLFCEKKIACSRIIL